MSFCSAWAKKSEKRLAKRLEHGANSEKSQNQEPRSKAIAITVQSWPSGRRVNDGYVQIGHYV